MSKLTVLLAILIWANPAKAVVTPLDTFGIAVLGSSNGANPVYLVSPLSATFGLTQSLAGTGAGGAQTVTVTSSENVTLATTSDTITVSVPTNFVPSGTQSSDGGVISTVQFRLGDNSAGSNPLDFLTQVVSPTYSGYSQYGGGTFTFPPSVLALATGLTNNAMSLTTIETISTTDFSAISPDAFRSFSFTVTYSNVPEPSVLRMLLTAVPVLALWRFLRTGPARLLDHSRSPEKNRIGWSF